MGDRGPYYPTLVDATGVLSVNSVPLLGVALGGMAVSPNGDRLYVYDRANHSVYILDTQTLATLSTWVLRGDLNGWGQLLAVRSNGEELLVTNNGDVLRVAGFQTLPSMQIEPGLMTATLDGKRLYVLSESGAKPPVRAYDIDFSANPGNSLRLAYMGALNVPYSTGVADVAVSPDGSQVYTASAIPVFCQVGDAANVESPSRLLSTVKWWNDTTPDDRTSPNNVEVDKFGLCFVEAPLD